MKKQPTKTELEAEVQQLKDQLTGPHAPEYYLVTLADHLKDEAERARLNIVGLAAGTNWDYDARSRVAMLISSLNPDLLTKFQLSALLEASPEVALARETVYPIQERLKEAEERLARYIAEIGEARRRVEAEIASRLEEMRRSPEVLELEERLRELEQT